MICFFTATNETPFTKQLLLSKGSPVPGLSDHHAVRNGSEVVLESLLHEYLQDVTHTPMKNIPFQDSHNQDLQPAYGPLSLKSDHVDILKLTGKYFPFADVEPPTLKVLRSRMLHQCDLLSKPGTTIQSSISLKIKPVLKKQLMIMHIMQRDLAHIRHVQELQNKQCHERCISAILRKKRLISARAHRYFRDYEAQLQSRLLQARTREEQTFIRTFEKGLKLQKEEVRNSKKCMKESSSIIENEVCSQLIAMENWYPKFS
jgi:hypothetical protein